MSATIHDVKGYDDYQNKINELSLFKRPLYCWYFGSRLENGQSWCGDCRDSEPVIRNFLSNLQLKENIDVILTQIDKDDYKGPDCKFKCDDKIKLLKIPTLFSPSLGKRLVEIDCMDISKLDYFFSDVKKA